MPQLCQARRCRRSGPAIEMVGAALKALREMQYFLSGTGELTRSRCLTQHAGDRSIMLGTGHSRHVSHKRWLRTTEAPGGTAPISAAMAPTCAPGVVRPPVRNTVAPLPIARLGAPAVPVPTASTAIAHQLNMPRRAKLDPRRAAPNRGCLCRGSEG